MRKCLLWLLLLPLMTGCTALPAEERAFAVALAIAREGAEWRVSARIPTYQSDGGYATLTGRGDTLTTALADLDDAAPMRLHLGQLRLVVLDAGLGADLMPTLHSLASLPEMRLAALAAVTQEDAASLMAAMKPGSGTRLSKSLDVLAETRVEQGVIPPSTLSAVVRMGERQSPVLAGVEIREDAVELLGGWPVDAQGKLSQPLAAGEMQLLSLLQGRAKNLRLTEADAAEVREISAKARLNGNAAQVQLKLRLVRGGQEAEALEALLARRCLTLLTGLYASGCDVLGLGRQAVRNARDMGQWQAMAWTERLAQLQWTVSVRVQPGT